MDSKQLQPRKPMFLLPITREILGQTDTPIPQAFLKKYGRNCPNLITLCFRNGDIYQCRLCKSRNSILGMLKIFKRFAVDTCSLFIFEQVTIADLMVIIIAPNGVEIGYPLANTYQPYKKETMQILSTGELTTKVIESGVKNSQNGAMLFWNTNDNPERSIEFLVDGDDVDIEDSKLVKMQFGREEALVWEHGSAIFVCVGNQFWKVGVKRIANASRLGMGWDVLQKACNIQKGDYIEMIEHGNLYHFQMNIYAGYSKFQQSIGGKHKPIHFVKIVTQKLISSGELVIPRMFWKISDTSLNSLPVIGMSDGRRFVCNYNRYKHILGGLQDLIQGTGVEDGDLILFQLLSTGLLRVTLFNGQAISFRGRSINK